MTKTSFPIAVACQGEYRADLTRDTFAPLANFRRVIAQQGRPILDTDLNEQTAILLHYLECLAEDVGGPYFGAASGSGFAIDMTGGSGTKPTFTIGRGRYYVGGVLCENFDDKATLATQPYGPVADTLEKEQPYLLYLDVWERHLTPLHYPAMREVALGGPDTATRAEVVWQVKTMKTTALDNVLEFSHEDFRARLAEALQVHPGNLRLRAKTKEPVGSDSPCLAAPSSRYRGVENQLYRVEVHAASAQSVQLKWSRENASVLYRAASLDGAKLTLTTGPRDARLGLSPEDWVELVDDDPSQATWWGRITAIDPDNLELTLKQDNGSPTLPAQRIHEGHVSLRRWDQRTPTGLLSLPYGSDWIELERGIVIKLDGPELATEPKRAQPGDYWLIPARVATGDVEWPRSANGDAIAMRPHGVVHQYAPLAYVAHDGQEWKLEKLRRTL